MKNVWAKLKCAWEEVRPLLIASLVIALILPMLSGFAPNAKAEPVTALLQGVEFQLCAKLGHAPEDQGKPPAGQHDHDCPCCLPTASGSVALPVEAGIAGLDLKPRFEPLNFDALAVALRVPQVLLPNRQRGPPGTI